MFSENFSFKNKDISKLLLKGDLFQTFVFIENGKYSVPEDIKKNYVFFYNLLEELTSPKIRLLYEESSEFELDTENEEGPSDLINYIIWGTIRIISIIFENNDKESKSITHEYFVEFGISNNIIDLIDRYRDNSGEIDKVMLSYLTFRKAEDDAIDNGSNSEI